MKNIENKEKDNCKIKIQRTFFKTVNQFSVKGNNYQLKIAPNKKVIPTKTFKKMTFTLINKRKTKKI